MAEETTSFSTFTLFTQLPYDLRYMIWMAARPGPRIVYLHSYYLKSPHSHQICERCAVYRDEESSESSASSDWVYDGGYDLASDTDAEDEYGHILDSFIDSPYKTPKFAESTRQFLELFDGVEDNSVNHKSVSGIAKMMVFAGFDNAGNMWSCDEEANPDVHEIVCVPKQNCTLACTGFKSYEPSVPVLTVCRESYGILSPFYTRAFGTSAPFPETWFDFKRDTLYLDIFHPNPNQTWGGVSKPQSSFEAVYYPEEINVEEALKVERLALDSLGEASVNREIWLARVLQVFKNVKEVSFVNNCSWWTGYRCGYRGEVELNLVLENEEMPKLRGMLLDKFLYLSPDVREVFGQGVRGRDRGR